MVSGDRRAPTYDPPFTTPKLTCMEVYSRAAIFRVNFSKMKAILTTLLFLFCLHASAQSISTAVQYDKGTKQGLMLYLPYSEEVAEGTILAKLKEIGFEPETKGSLFWKQNKVNGFYVYKGVVLKGDNPQVVDLYFKVDRRGSKRDNQSVMYLLTSKGGENFISESSDATAFVATRQFLNGFTTETATYKHTLDVQAGEEAVRKAEKKFADLQADEQDLTKKIAKLQDDLRKNKEAQETQKATIDAEKKKLEEMRNTKQ